MALSFEHIRNFLQTDAHVAHLPVGQPTTSSLFALMNTPSDTRQRAISIRQPWAWAVIHAGKDVENRSATAPRQFKSAVGQRVLIHASSHRLNWADMAAAVARLKERGVACPSRSDLMYSGIIGSVLVTGIVTRHRSPWFRGPYALVFADPRPEPFMPVRGQVGLFRVQP